MTSHLNNSFPFIPFQDKSDVGVFMDERNANNTSFSMNLLKFFNDVEKEESLEQTTNPENNLNLSQSQSKKKNNLEDMSYSIEQAFCEKSLMNIEEEEFRGNEENYLKIGNEDQSQGIDPIQEVNYFEQGNNDSFIHENNYLFHNLTDMTTNSFDVCNMTSPSDLMTNKLDSTMEESELQKMKKNIVSLKLSKSTIINNNNNFNINRSVTNSDKTNKQLFTVSTISNSIETLNSSFKLNVSAVGSLRPKRGRRKFLIDGIKTELIDKAYIREFKKYLKLKKNQFKPIFEEEPSFWNEFFQNSNPPFWFTNSLGEKVEYKSFSKNFLKMIFSKQSARNLYSQFIKEKEKELMMSILSKRNKKMNKNMLVFYKFYGKNMHKLYSDEYNISDLNCDDLEMTFADSVNMSL